MRYKDVAIQELVAKIAAKILIGKVYCNLGIALEPHSGLACSQHVLEVLFVFEDLITVRLDP